MTSNEVEGTNISNNATNRSSSSLLSMPISSIMNSNMAVLNYSQTAVDAIRVMNENSIRSVLVSNLEKQVIGLVSKTDILFKIVSMHKSPAKVTLREIMSTPIISIPPEMSIADALSAMEKHVIRQLLISSGNNVYGIITREDIMMKMERAFIETAHAFRTDSPELCIMNPFASVQIKDRGSILTCPHCQIEHQNKEQLSKHIKGIHNTVDG
jgi:CBS domain-containing protein